MFLRRGAPTPSKSSCLFVSVLVPPPLITPLRLSPFPGPPLSLPLLPPPHVSHFSLSRSYSTCLSLCSVFPICNPPKLLFSLHSPLRRRHQFSYDSYFILPLRMVSDTGFLPSGLIRLCWARKSVRLFPSVELYSSNLILGDVLNRFFSVLCFQVFLNPSENCKIVLSWRSSFLVGVFPSLSKQRWRVFVVWSVIRNYIGRKRNFTLCMRQCLANPV